ncbi:aminoacyl-tRNA hydrolase [Roseomonas sp. NAR14]|uniref:Aminoacyl-tRNA hydrolase n=1 Tax=Roseomonas acroporae TaxID=2937791 RepID=A0A9X1Y427_9PROT|nr:alternative ribosome rescue aminoacyl-tRNA hydrolase ArfB [Roseomonas acroporae]MCK8782903.1 aminoacyl-tRNA hydrolase [Roseomonas acroporae]
MPIPVTPRITLDDDEVQESHVRASGPGGQHVNKTSTAIELRFDARGSPSLPEALREKLIRLAGSRATAEGVIVIKGQQFRSQLRNRQDALERLLALIREAAAPPPPTRRPTRPTLGSKKRRLEAKTLRGSVKQNRQRPPEE